MKILLTGANGMLGRNLLASPGAAKHQWLTPSSKELNLIDESLVAEYLHLEQPDLVIHAAGKVGGIQANIKDPVGFLCDNMRMGLNLITQAQKQGIKKLLNIGSSCMYPRQAKNPIREEVLMTGELEPTNEGYALAKLSCARLCSYINQIDLSCRYKTIIPCNLYGPYDKFSPHNSHLVPAIIRKLHEALTAEEESVEIWGSGEVRREFLFAPDLAEFIIEACTRFDELPEMMNVGLGHDYSINDYYRICAEVMGYKGNFRHSLDRPEGMRQKLVDISRLQEFGWVASNSLEEGLKKTLEYYLKYEDCNE